MAIDVFAADEQDQRSVDVRRFSDLTMRVVESLALKGDVEVSLLFVDEESMAELNERFLGETGPTDVLAFPIEDDLRLRHTLMFALLRTAVNRLRLPAPLSA